MREMLTSPNPLCEIRGARVERFGRKLRTTYDVATRRSRMRPEDLFSPETARDPYPFYRMMRDQHPLYFHEGLKSFVVSRHADVESILRSPASSTSPYAWQLEPVHGRTLLQMDGKEHATHRNIVAPALRGRDLAEKLLPVVV